MKYALFIGLMLGVLSSCEKKEETEIVGTWHLIEILADPGDGSGTFTPVTSSKTIEFHSNGTFSSNGDMCNMSSDATMPSSGNYSTIDQTLSSASCVMSTLPISYEIVNGELIISYPCFEPCRAKFELVP